MKKKMTLSQMREVLEDVQVDLRGLHTLRENRDKAVAGWDSEKSVKEWQEPHRLRMKLEAKNSARTRALEIFDSITAPLKTLQSEHRFWSRAALLEQASFYAPRKIVAVTEQERQAKAQLEELAGLRNDVQALRWAMVLPRMSGAGLVALARREAQSPALLRAIQEEHDGRLIEIGNVVQTKEKTELLKIIDSLELEGEKEAVALFEEVEKTGKETLFLHDALVATDSAGAERAGRALADQAIFDQFFHREEEGQQ